MQSFSNHLLCLARFKNVRNKSCSSWINWIRWDIQIHWTSSLSNQWLIAYVVSVYEITVKKTAYVARVSKNLCLHFFSVWKKKDLHYREDAFRMILVQNYSRACFLFFGFLGFFYQYCICGLVYIIQLCWREKMQDSSNKIENPLSNLKSYLLWKINFNLYTKTTFSCS